MVGAVAGAAAALTSAHGLSQTPIQLDMVAPPGSVVVFALIMLAIANAFGEETLWRGVLVDETRGLRAGGIASVQFASFGFAHWYGLPPGPLGVMLAGTYSCALYWLATRRGMRASVTAHAVTDVILFTAVLPSVLFTGWFAA